MPRSPRLTLHLWNGAMTMQFLHRDAWPRWARGVTSPWLISPLLVVALAIGGFTAYGAWTRAHPTHYARGGAAFGVDGLETSPSPTASAGLAKVAKGKRPPAGAAGPLPPPGPGEGRPGGGGAGAAAAGGG